MTHDTLDNDIFTVAMVETLLYREHTYFVFKMCYEATYVYTMLSRDSILRLLQQTFGTGYKGIPSQLANGRLPGVCCVCMCVCCNFLGSIFQRSLQPVWVDSKCFNRRNTRGTL